jgi:geranylgeranylglycerol-phosphate geranylgeranyltransferase
MIRRALVSLEILRPHNMLAAALCVVAGHRVAGGTHTDAALVAAGFAALATGAGNVINDYFDVDIDRVNKPRRPLPSNRMTPRGALWLYAVLSAALLAAFAALPTAVALLAWAWHLSLFAYAAKLKRVFVVGNVLVAAITSSAFVAGAMLAGHPSASVVPVLIGFFFVWGRELVKGAEDVEGDRAVGAGTLAVVAGVGRAVSAAAALMLCLAILIPLPALVRYYGARYFLTMEALVVPALIGSAWLISARPDRASFNRASWILKAGMFFGILAIAVARS